MTDTKRHLDGITEMSWLAYRLKELSDMLQTLDDPVAVEVHREKVRRSLPSASDELCRIKLREIEQDLWAQYHGIVDYMAYSFPVDTKDCLILSVAIWSKVRDVMLDGKDGTEEFTEDELLVQRMLGNLINCLQQETGTTTRELGVHFIFDTAMNDKNREAVAICAEVRQREWSKAKAVVGPYASELNGSGHHAQAAE